MLVTLGLSFFFPVQRPSVVFETGASTAVEKHCSQYGGGKEGRRTDYENSCATRCVDKFLGIIRWGYLNECKINSRQNAFFFWLRWFKYFENIGWKHNKPLSQTLKMAVLSGRKMVDFSKPLVDMIYLLSWFPGEPKWVWQLCFECVELPYLWSL